MAHSKLISNYKLPQMSSGRVHRDQMGDQPLDIIQSKVKCDYRGQIQKVRFPIKKNFYTRRGDKKENINGRGGIQELSEIEETKKAKLGGSV